MGIMLIFLLTACGNNPAEDVYQHLEAAVELEQPFEEQQQPLQNAEMRENELFEEIIAIGTSEIEKIQSLADEALNSIDSRKQMLDIEKESIEASYQEFIKIKEYKEQFEKEEVLSSLEELQAAMEERYQQYQLLYDSYNEAANRDQELFNQLKSEDLIMEELQTQVQSVNEQYEVVEEHKEAFNTATDSYNENKRNFYEAAELNISYD